MSASQSSNSVLANAQVVARLWVTGKGCRYFHSDNLNDQECRSLFDDLAAHTLPAEDSRKTVVGEVQGRKCAFFVHERVPDPNNSHRNVTNSWFLLDKSGSLNLPLVEAFAQNPVYAETQADFVDRLRQADLKPSVVSPPLDVGAPTSRTDTPSAKATRKRTSVLRVGLPVVILIALISVLAILSKQESSNADPEDAPPINEAEELDSRWGSEELKFQLREAVGQADANNLEDGQLLDLFLRHFSFDPEVLNLTPQQFANMLRQSKDSPPNPFTKFLLELPRPQEIDDSSIVGSTPQRFHDHLKQLASKICTDRNGKQLNLTNLNPVEIVKALRDRRDYLVYYESWHHQFQPNQKTDPWLNQWQVEGVKSWIPQVRDFIQENFD